MTSVQQPGRYMQPSVYHPQKSSQASSNIDNVAESIANAKKRLSQTSTHSTSKRKSENKIGPWRLGRTLGRGSTGRVRLAKHCVNGQLSAVKIVPKSTPNKKKSKRSRIDANGLPYGIEREIIIMKLISHPNIMGLYDVWENQNELYLVLEYVEGGELFDYLMNNGRLSEQEAVNYFRQIINGVEYCHRFNICHRDLKPENILLDKDHNIKIADFGMAALETRQKLLETSCGSPHYASPEIVAGRTYHGSPSDVWSCGIILFALLTGHLPFDDPNIRKLLLKVQSGKYHMPTTLSPEAKDLIHSMLKVNPKDRISISHILNHPLLKKYPAKILENSQQQLMENINFDKPVTNLDPDILHNLQTLWHGLPQPEIIKKLSTNSRNAEKMFYYLLEKYKATHIDGTEFEMDGMKRAGNRAINNNKKPKSINKRQPPVSALPSKPSSKQGIPRSASTIVKTTIQDENGDVLKSSIRELPSNSRINMKKRNPLTTRSNSSLNVHLNNSVSSRSIKKPIIASSSSRRLVSFTHKKTKSISRSSSNRSIKIPTPVTSHPPTPTQKKIPLVTTNANNRLTLPALPDLEMNEFKHLVGIIFEDEPTEEAMDYKENTKKQLQGGDSNKEPTSTVKIYEDETQIFDRSANSTAKTDLSLLTTSISATTAITKPSDEISKNFKNLQNANIIKPEKPQTKPQQQTASTNNSLVSAATSDSSIEWYSAKSFSLDPKVRNISGSGGSGNNSGASAVLEKFGVKMNKNGTLTPAVSTTLSKSTGKSGISASGSLRRLGGLKTSSSSSVRNLNCYLDSKNTVTMDEFNKSHNNDKNVLSITRIPSQRSGKSSKTVGGSADTSFAPSHGSGKSVDHSIFSYDVTYSIHSAVQVPLISPTAVHFPDSSKLDKQVTRQSNLKPLVPLIPAHAIGEDKFADAETDNSDVIMKAEKLNQSNSELKIHRKADSTNSTHESNLSKYIQQPYKAARCSLLANSNYEMPEETKSSAKKLNFSPEKKRSSSAPVTSNNNHNNNQVDDNDKSSMFEDPEEDTTFMSNGGIFSPNSVRENTTIFDDSNNLMLSELENIKTAELINMRKQRASMATLENHIPDMSAFAHTSSPAISRYHPLFSATLKKSPEIKRRIHTVPEERSTHSSSTVPTGFTQQNQVQQKLESLQVQPAQDGKPTAPPVPISVLRRTSVKDRIISGLHKASGSSDSNKATIDMSPKDPNFSQRKRPAMLSLSNKNRLQNWNEESLPAGTVEPSTGGIMEEEHSYRPSWIKRFFNNFKPTTQTATTPTTVSRNAPQKKKKKNSIFSRKTLSYTLESDKLTAQQVFDHLKEVFEEEEQVKIKLNDSINLKFICYLPDYKKTTFKVEINDFEGVELGFTGCSIVVSKVSGNGKVVKQCADTVKEKIVDLGAERAKRISC